MALLVSNVDWPGDDAEPIALLADHLGVSPSEIVECTVVRKSLDARHRKQTWKTSWRVVLADEAALLARAPHSIRAWTDKDDRRYARDSFAPVARSWPPSSRAIVVGAGPAGLFAALTLAEAGAPVLLLERGAAIEARVPAVNRSWQRKEPLNPENNVLFGEGGAGTFSDGKIYTRRRDGDLGYVFRRLVDCGADPAILQESYAHLGTDRVRALLPVLRQRLLDLGVEVRFGTRVVDLQVEGGVCTGVILAGGAVEHGTHVFVAAGHSARDAGEMLIRAGVAAEARPIAIGVRIEHPQTLIDAATYGKERGDLPPASYRLAHNPKGGRQAYTFCMCPGGMIVPAANQPERIVVNGMSFAARRAFWANSAVIVAVSVDDYGTPPEGTPAALAGYAWQDRIEVACFRAAGADYRAPAQRFVDLVEKRVSSDLPKSSFPLGVAPADLRELLPPFVVRGMIDAVRRFDRQLVGFAGDEAILVAPETRTTSPVRFLRDGNGQATTVSGLFPIGEGAGYGGGIISCALDGHRVARGVVDAISGTR